MQSDTRAIRSSNKLNERKWWILSVTSLGALLSALNFSTLIIALPDLIRSLHASLLQAMWIMLAYMVAKRWESM